MRAAPPTPSRSEPDWRTTGPCKDDADAMFPTSNAAEIEHAKSYCRMCPVIERCLQWALETGEEYGVWGGLSEKERRALRRRAARPISIDDYTDQPSPRTMHASRTLDEAWAEFTQEDGEHVLWTGPKVVHQPGGNLTPNRLAFRLDRGYWPDGGVTRTCSVDRCVKPAHLTDRRERIEEADLAVAV